MSLASSCPGNQGEQPGPKKAAVQLLSHDLLDEYFFLSNVSHESGTSEIVKFKKLSALHHWKHKTPFLSSDN